MGELADLQSARAGQFVLNDWLGQLDNAATPKGLIPVILPTQEMREFQRRYRFDGGSQDLLMGERLTLSWTVPRNEWWRPRTLMFTNKDSTVKVVRVEFTVDNTGTNIYRAVETRVSSGESKIIYGAHLDGAIGTDFPTRFASLLPSIMEPNDVMTMVQTQNVTIASEQSWILIYELVPAPTEPLTRGVAAAATVV